MIEFSSPRAFAKPALFQRTQQKYYSTINLPSIIDSIPSFPTEIAIRSDVSNAGAALGNGRGESLLLPSVFLGNVFDSRKPELGSSVFQVFTTQEINRGARIRINERRMIGDTMRIIPQVIERIDGGVLLHRSQQVKVFIRRKPLIYVRCGLNTYWERCTCSFPERTR